MYLTKSQERALAGEEGETVQKAMEILVALGDIYGADKLIPISSSHVSGVSIQTSGKAGLEFVESLASSGARVKVPTTINPAGMDLERWRELRIPEELAELQRRMVRAYQKMGAQTTCTCTPYLAGNKPRFGDHLSWSESSAVVYANSVLGARTNREGSPASLASAVCGLTPNHGFHLDENRGGDVRIIPDPKLLEGEETWPYSVLGYWVGMSFPDSVPVMELLHPSLDQLKALGAAMASSGAISLFHVPGLTPEAKLNPSLCQVRQKASFGEAEFKEVVDKLDLTQEADLVCVGCPHCSFEELKQLEGIRFKREVWACTSRPVAELARRTGLGEKLEGSGVKIVCDTCMVVAPMREMGYQALAVNSAKAAYYAPSLAKVNVRFAPLKELAR